MKTLASLWIDHREAVIVLVSGKRRETRRIKSHVEPQLRSSGLSSSPGRFQAPMVPDDGSREHETNYYDEVLAGLRGADAIMVFGPGDAKGELKKRIERNKLNLRITRFVTTDRMTERQVSQQVRRHSLRPGSTVSSRGTKRR